jgi:hypothetical protein
MEDKRDAEMLADSSSSHGNGERPQADLPDAADDRVDMRVQRLTDYRRDSLAIASSLEASLGAVNADLLELAYLMKPVLAKALASEPTLAKLEELAPIFDPYLKVTRQAERFTQLAIRLRESRPGASQSHRARKLAQRAEREDPVLRYPPSSGGWPVDPPGGRDVE